MMRQIALIFLSFLALSSYGQMSKALVSGLVVDRETGKPVEFASVGILNPTDSSLITGNITDPEGKFEIPVQKGRYLIMVQFISYENAYVGPYDVSGKTNIGTIQISPESTTLEEVVVSGEKTQVEVKLDKRVYNIGKDLSNTAATASDVLDRLPSITVDVDGNVSLRGGQGVRVLIDGKPSGLLGIGGGAQGLQQLTGEMIERVEVITNPSARYDAEGTAGIINIILKKDERKGINGSIQMNTGYPHNHGVSANLNFRRKWYNLFLNYGVSYRKTPGGGLETQYYDFGDANSILERDRNYTRWGLNQSFRMGSEFFLNEKNTITVSGLYRIGDDGNEYVIDIDSLSESGTLLNQRQRVQEETEDEGNYQFSINYKRTFDKKGQELTADLQYENSGEVEAADIFGYDIENGNRIPTTFQKSENDEAETEWFGQINYKHPIGEKGKFETGYRGQLRTIENDYIVFNQGENGELVVNPDFTNDFYYRENVQALYAQFGNESGKWSYQAGLRLEYTDILTELRVTDEVNPRDYLNLFPSVFLTYNITEKQSLQANYSRRIQRPRFWYLNPFFTIADDQNIRAGNPNLNPEFTDSYEFGFLNEFDKGSLYTAVYYRQTQDVIFRASYRIDSVNYSIPSNLGIGRNLGVEINYNMDFTKWWNMNLSVNGFYNETEGTFQQGTFEEQEFYVETMSFNARMSNRFKIGNSFDMQLNSRYIAPQEEAQGRRKSLFIMDFAVSKDIFKNKGTLALNVSDVFNSGKWRSETEFANLYSESTFQWRPRQITLSLTYRINQKKRPQRGRGDYGGGDMGEF
ncbi:outer membrane beta-barrel family protein [Mangrovivirga sp. M17]|uniref:Outer membrane beta-barrel family protein n=1 Tax=Mangrovivirga halotolerans TaxID=2993936 RepID=A0ABT3RPS9_9BACT|nr:outer membrane beta-barrel family protein [Mangrovivirga halotolerans]MCX2743538.1 outer membrane beta-barrel family protein [Mangrovivirga halotolerans]